jgi:hypothetical protein
VKGIAVAGTAVLCAVLFFAFVYFLGDAFNWALSTVLGGLNSIGR